MATVIESSDPAPKFATRVDEQIAEATSRIRGHDLAFGGLVVGGLVLGYAAGMMLLDRLFVLPEWARQLGLLGCLGATGVVAYRTLIRPLRRQVNPLYAAVVVEKTIDDAKNSVVGYVEARGRQDVHPSVKAAMGARAAKSVTEADVNRAVDHRSLVYTGAAVVALFLALVVLFFVFRPAQFQSLLGRAFTPFSSDPIASRTQIALVEPQGGDVTVTAGQSMTVKVAVGGQVPRADRADKMRVLVRYSPEAEYDPLPMEPGETSREWLLQLRPDQLRTGAWYKVVGGDGETAEHRVTVRTAPLFTDFEVSYEFPAYTRRPPEKSTDPHLQAIRNTKVSVVARANRQVRDGRAVFDPPGQQTVSGKALPDRPDALRFDFLLGTPGSYRLTFNAADGERSPDSLPFGIKVDEDFPPTVEITRPEPDDVMLPANGLLSVDGAAGDDFGLDKMTLKLKLAAPAERALADIPYLGGKSFRRDADGTYPRSLDYKGSVEFSKLTDPAGEKVELKEGMVLEYWLEATDNRTKPGPSVAEPDPNVGKSRVKRVRLTPPVETPDQKQQQDDRREQRKSEEQKHAADQQQKLDREDRGPPPPADPMAQPKKENDPKADNPPPMPPDMGKKQPDMSKEANGVDKGSPEKSNDAKSKGEPMPMSPDKKGMSDAMNPQKQDEKSSDMGMPQQNGMGTKNDMPEQAPMPSDPGRKNVQEQANKVQDQLNQEKNGGGSPKSAPTANEEERTNPAEQKSNPPPMGATPPDSQQKQTDGGMGASEPRPEGNVRPPEPPSNTKSQPPPMGGGADQQPSEKRNEPLGGQPGTDRETPKSSDPPMASPMTKGTPPGKDNTTNKSEGTPPSKGDPAGGGEPKPATQQKDSDPTGMGQPQQNPADNAGRAKTAPPTNDRGEERNAQPNPTGGTQPQPPPNARSQEGGEPKPDRPQDPGSVRPMPKEGDPPPPGGKEGEPKTGDPTGASEPRPGPAPMTKSADPKMGDPKGGTPEAKGGMPEAKGVEPGTERPAPSDVPPPGTPPQAPMPKSADPTKGGPEAGPMTPMPMGKGATEPMGTNQKDPNPMPAPMPTPKGMGMGDPKMGPMEDMNPKGSPDPKNGTEPGGKANPKGAPDPKFDPKDVDEALRNLNSKDEAKRRDAQEKLDRTFGEKARREAEQLQDDLNSKDPARQKQAQERLEQLRQQAEQMAKDNPPGAKGRGDDERFREGGGVTPKNAGPMADDPRNRAKSAELTLDQFEKNRHNRDLQQRLGWTQEEYDRFLEDYRREVERLRRDAAEADVNPPTPPTAPPRPDNINAGGKIDGSPNATSGAARVGGPAFAPPGYSDALRRFQEGAAKGPTPRPPAPRP
jgi:hypothetical protein